MWLNPQETTDLVTFNEEIFSENLYFLCSVCKKKRGFITDVCQDPKYTCGEHYLDWKERNALKFTNLNNIIFN